MSYNFNEFNQASRQIRPNIANGQRGTLQTKLDWARHTGIWGAHEIDTENIRVPKMRGWGSMLRGSQSSGVIMVNITLRPPQLNKLRRTNRGLSIEKKGDFDLKIKPLGNKV